MEMIPPIKQSGFLPCGKDGTNEMGRQVAELTNGKVVYIAPETPSLHLEIVPPEKIERITWAN